MSQNSIEQVKAAEQKAEELVSSAHNEAVVIINDAKKAAQRIIADSGETVREIAAGAVTRAEQKSLSLEESRTAELEAAAQELRKSAAGSTKEAVALIHKLFI